MTLTTGERLYHGFLKVADDACPYFSQWTWNAPLVISEKTNAQLNNIQKILYKLICYFVEHYDEYRDVMPISEKVDEIISLCNQMKPYRPGTYRTDFIVDEHNQIKLTEITCRFALNTFFTSGFFNLMVEGFLKDKPAVHRIDEYTPLFDYFIQYFGEFKHVCLLKGLVDKNESKYLIPILEKAGYLVHIISIGSIGDQLHLLKDAAVISELDQTELCNLPLDTIGKIMASNVLNDLRTVFLVHDKRMFSIISNEWFLKKVLSEAEIRAFQKMMIPTYSRLQRPDLWAEAQQKKDDWIIKPHALGRSINVFAGCVTSEAEWQQVFASDLIEAMILQPYIAQRKFGGSVGDRPYHDYVAGTLLFFDDHFFGPGMFRASSFPVTNKVDDRKIASLVTADIEYFDPQLIL